MRTERFKVGVCALAAGFIVAGCGDAAQTSTPAAMGGGNNPTPSTADATRVAPAPDSQAGGSSGFKGMRPVPDSSGGPTTNSDRVGGNPGSSSAAGMGAAAPATTTNGGLPASALGSVTQSGSTNSTPNSSTGNASR